MGRISTWRNHHMGAFMTLDKLIKHINSMGGKTAPTYAQALKVISDGIERISDRISIMESKNNQLGFDVLSDIHMSQQDLLIARNELKIQRDMMEANNFITRDMLSDAIKRSDFEVLLMCIGCIVSTACIIILAGVYA